MSSVFLFISFLAVLNIWFVFLAAAKHWADIFMKLPIIAPRPHCNSSLVFILPPETFLPPRKPYLLAHLLVSRSLMNMWKSMGQRAQLSVGDLLPLQELTIVPDLLFPFYGLFIPVKIIPAVPWLLSVLRGPRWRHLSKAVRNQSRLYHVNGPYANVCSPFKDL